MSEFMTVLRGHVQSTLENLAAAQQAKHDYEIYLHVTRIKDLLGRAERHGIDSGGWFDPEALATAEAQGESR